MTLELSRVGKSLFWGGGVGMWKELTPAVEGELLFLPLLCRIVGVLFPPLGCRILRELVVVASERLEGMNSGDWREKHTTHCQELVTARQPCRQKI